MYQIAWHAGICAISSVIKNAYKSELSLSLPVFIRTSHSRACSVHDLIQPLSFSLFPPPYSVFYSNFIFKTSARRLGGRHIPSLLSFTKLYNRIRKFCTSTQEEIHRNLKNSQCIWNSFITFFYSISTHEERDVISERCLAVSHTSKRDLRRWSRLKV